MSKVTLKNLSGKFDALSERHDNLTGQVGIVSKQVSALSGRFDALSEQIDKLAISILKSFEAFDQRVNQRFDRLETNIGDIKLRLDNTAYDFDVKNLDKRVTKIEKKIGIATK